MDIAAELAAQMGMTMAELLGGAELSKVVIAQKYVHGKQLVDNEKLHQMPTHFWNLHAWYLLSSNREKIMLVAKVTEEYYFHEEEIHINFSELFQLMNQTPLINLSSVAIVYKLLNSLSISCSILSVH
jgi:hypothetical protein